MPHITEDVSLRKVNFIVIDFEGTTPAGFGAEPIEVGAMVLRPTGDGLACAARYEALIRPPEHAPLTAAGTRQTGITASMLAERPAAPAVLAGLDALLTDPPYLVVAHHASTEAGILRRYAHACPTAAFAPMLDTLTLTLARRCHPGQPSYSLDALLHLYRIPIPAARHRALADAEVTARLLVRLLADGAHRHGWHRLAELRQLAGTPPPANAATPQALF